MTFIASSTAIALAVAAAAMASSAARAGTPIATQAGPGSPELRTTALQQPSPAAPDPAASDASANVLVLHFDIGSTAIRPSDVALLDKASRLYRDAHPIRMMLTAGSDTVGPPDVNLRISQSRAYAVLEGLVERGIPAERFELVAKGEADLAVATPNGVADPRNRRVEIRWR